MKQDINGMNTEGTLTASQSMDSVNTVPEEEGYENSLLKVTQKNGKTSSPVGFVTFSTKSMADIAKQELQGVKFDPDLPQTIRLEFAKSNTKVSKPKQHSPPVASLPTFIHPAAFTAAHHHAAAAAAAVGGGHAHPNEAGLLNPALIQAAATAGDAFLHPGLNAAMLQELAALNGGLHPAMFGGQALQGQLSLAQLTGGGHHGLFAHGGNGLQAMIPPSMAQLHQAAMLAQHQQQQQQQQQHAHQLAQAQAAVAAGMVSGSHGSPVHGHHPVVVSSMPSVSLAGGQALAAAQAVAVLARQQQNQSNNASQSQHSMGSNGNQQFIQNGSTSSAPPCSTLFVANLGPMVSEDELRSIFQSFPGFCRIRLHNKNGSPVAFVEYQDIPHATQSMSSLQGFVLLSSDRGGIRIEFAKNKMGEKPLSSNASDVSP